MIPKIIHYCWLSDGPLPASVRQYIDTWQRYLPDYEIRLWNFDVFPKEKSQWVAEAFDSKKYAFAADYIRCYALYHYGGIYLDSDVEVLKSFNPLLKLPYVLGFENGTNGCIEAGIMMAEPGHKMYKEMLDYYDAKGHFVEPDGTLNTTPLPYLLRDIACKDLTIVKINSPEEFDYTPSNLSVLPFDYFSPIHLEHRELQKTDRTYTIHHFAASWERGWKKYRVKLKRFLGPKLTQAGIKIKRAIKRFLSRTVKTLG